MHRAVVLGTAHPHIFGMAETAKAVKGMQLVGVYDDDAGRLAEAAKKMGVPALKTLDEALACKPALTLIGAVPSDRAMLAERSIAAGAAAFVDKPIAVTRPALDTLMKAQKRHGTPPATPARRPRTSSTRPRGATRCRSGSRRSACPSARPAGWAG